MNTKLTLEDKMDLWHEGVRKMNIKACSDEKLGKYYEICNNKGFALESNALYREMVMRGLEPEEMEFKKRFILSLEQVCEYIENHMNYIGDDGQDLFKFVEGDKVFYSWSCAMDDSMDGYECMIDFKTGDIEIDEKWYNIKDAREVVYAVNGRLFGC